MHIMNENIPPYKKGQIVDDYLGALLNQQQLGCCSKIDDSTPVIPKEPNTPKVPKKGKASGS